MGTAATVPTYLLAHTAHNSEASSIALVYDKVEEDVFIITYKELACRSLYFSVTNFISDLLLIYINLQLTILHKDTN